MAAAFFFFAGLAERCETRAGAERCDNVFWRLQ
jgi:hypothetical protein